MTQEEIGRRVGELLEAAVKDGRCKKTDRFSVREEKSDDGVRVFVIRRQMWGNQTELIDSFREDEST